MDISLNEVLLAATNELKEKGHAEHAPQDLAQYINKTKSGKLIRKRFGEKMVIMTVPTAKNDAGEILRLFIGITGENEVGGVYSNYISEEQANLLDKA